MHSERARPYKVLSIRSFRYFLASRLLVTLGLLIQTVVVAWQVYELTQDPLSLGLIGLAEVIPAIGFALIAGHMIDRSDRHNWVVASYALSALIIAALGLFSVSHLPTRLHVNLIYAAMFCSGVVRAYMSPSVFSLFAEIVPKDLYVTGSVWSSATWQTAAGVGPALGGLLYGFSGVRTAYAAAFCLTLVGTFVMIPARKREKYDHKKIAREPLAKSLMTGLRFVFGEKVVLSALSLDLFAVLFGGAVALLPIFADKVLHVGPQGLGIMRAAPSVGAFLMSMVIAYRPPRQNAGRNLLFAVVGFGLCMIVFGLSRNFILSLVVLALSGAFDNVSVVVRSTILQTRTPDEMRGRVSAVNSIFIGSSNEIGDFESGVTARWWGAIPAVVFGGVMTLIVAGVTAWRSKSLRRLSFGEENPDPSKAKISGNAL